MHLLPDEDVHTILSSTDRDSLKRWQHKGKDGTLSLEHDGDLDEQVLFFVGEYKDEILSYPYKRRVLDEPPREMTLPNFHLFCKMLPWQPFGMELTVECTNKRVYVFKFSTNYKSPISHTYVSWIPLKSAEQQWSQLSVDVGQLVDLIYQAQFSRILLIRLKASIVLRLAFLTRDQDVTTEELYTSAKLLQSYRFNRAARFRMEMKSKENALDATARSRISKSISKVNAIDVTYKSRNNKSISKDNTSDTAARNRNSKSKSRSEDSKTKTNDQSAGMEPVQANTLSGLRQGIINTKKITEFQKILKNDIKNQEKHEEIKTAGIKFTSNVIGKMPVQIKQMKPEVSQSERDREAATSSKVVSSKRIIQKTGNKPAKSKMESTSTSELSKAQTSKNPDLKRPPTVATSSTAKRRPPTAANSLTANNRPITAATSSTAKIRSPTAETSSTAKIRSSTAATSLTAKIIAPTAAATSSTAKRKPGIKQAKSPEGKVHRTTPSKDNS